MSVAQLERVTRDVIFLIPPHPLDEKSSKVVAESH